MIDQKFRTLSIMHIEFLSERSQEKYAPRVGGTLWGGTESNSFSTFSAGSGTWKPATKKKKTSRYKGVTNHYVNSSGEVSWRSQISVLSD